MYMNNTLCCKFMSCELFLFFQSRLQEHYQTRRGSRSNHEGSSHSHSRPHPSHGHNNGASSTQPPAIHHHIAMPAEHRHHLPPPTQTHFHHIHPHVHPTHPTAVALVTPQPPHPVPAPTVAAAPGSDILPGLLSWQMSQSLNTYQWRMQTGNVPFFTFPSTPPSYIPANSYPYTFAPLPAPPFSISTIQPGAATATVAVPSYTGIAVPQATAVEPIVTLNSAPALAAGVVHAAQAPTFPVAAAAIPSLGDSGEAHLQNVTLASHHHATPGAATAVAVGINGATVNVIQQPVIHAAPVHEGSNAAGGIMVPTVSAAPAAAIHTPGHDLAVIHTLGPTHQHFQANSSLHAGRPAIQHVAHHAPAALFQSTIPANDDPASIGHHHHHHRRTQQVHLVRSSLANIDAQSSMGVAGPSSMSRDHQSSSSSSSSSARRRNDSSIFVSSNQSSRPSAYISLPVSSASTPTDSPSTSQFPLTPRVARAPSPSSGDESDSSITSSPGENFSSMFYPVPSYSPLISDSDGLESPDHLSESPNPFDGRDSTDILSEGSNNTSEQSDSDGETTSESSALHTLANAAVILAADSPSDDMDTSSSQPGPSRSNDGEPLRLPVLINISNSDSDTSGADTPTSVIDLTSSPTTSSPASLLSDAPPTTGSGSNVSRNLQSSLESAASANHDTHHLPHHAIATPLLVPVIQHQPTNVIAAGLAVRAQRSSPASFSAPANAPQVQMPDHAHRMQVSSIKIL